MCRIVPAFVLCLLLAGCGGGAGESAPDPFFDCDTLLTGVTVRNTTLDVSDNPNTKRIVEVTIIETFLFTETHTISVDIPPGASADICARPGQLYKLLVRYDDGTNGCVRFEISPFLCSPTGDGSSDLFAVNAGETERFRVTYRGF